jgi:hypothetical protein
MPTALDVKPIFLDTPRLTTAGHLPHSQPELPCAETTTSAPHLEAHLQAISVEQFPYSRDIVEKSACQVADRKP